MFASVGADGAPHVWDAIGGVLLMTPAERDISGRGVTMRPGRDSAPSTLMRRPGEKWLNGRVAAGALASASLARGSTVGAFESG